MRGKLIVWGYLVILSLGTMLNLYMPKTEAAAKESIVIPGEAIRLRILANSDFEEDQAIKRKVRDAVNAQITVWVQDLTSMNEAKKVINGKLPEIQEIAEKVVHEQGSNQSVKVEFGKVSFPTKLYGQYLYPAGEYQAILITLGKGEGANWWCVLYPPLCFLDFSNGVAVSDGFEEKHVAKAETISKKKQEDLKTDEAVVTSAPPVVEDEQTETAEEVEQPAKEGAQVQRKMVEEVQVEKTMVDEVHVEKKPEVELQDEKKQTEEVQITKKHVKEVKKAKKAAKKEAPIYTARDEEPVKVKFFVVEMWEKMFN
ncbi:stage II sporulation protein R [Bacillus sp. AFS076308]|uniref:stage II sporulation protein R n=1 Tax=unclassified Bacillus (in: firmicutes) TaxID=185979 RepID=UPI000BF6B588|nr:MULTISPECIES: stage II sporulation protein R [unclassified Bacillus (in: firmicutes)]PFO07946.1 stage II sporulation protein R [Bacillus sp. AFS076308]PGV51339.1 stage II sporulation protein R [Bacillus sp. AFS037270]